MDAAEDGRRAVHRRDPGSGSEGAVGVEDDPSAAPGDAPAPAEATARDADAVEVPRRPERTGHGPVGDLLLRLGGPLLVLLVLLVVLVVALVVLLVGSRQPDIVTLRDSGTVDNFARPDGDPIGAAPLQAPWDTIGDWRLVDGTAYLADAPGATGFAILPGEVTDGRVAATVYGIAGEGGIVARYRGPGDYVSLRPVPGQATWRLDVVSGGEVVTSETMGLIGAPEGSRVELVLDGSQVSVIVAGQLRGGPFDISSAGSGGEVGLIATLDEQGGSSRFDDVARERV
ncbi:hypothetical protein PO878_18345 [Iamia majanohamensis]|uniref:Uncharacterized protein n=1 Tax=Iamia majanohamensis TaxID=467976 RepID=A0AAE9Y4Z7_9ACTN|nr:hypothetical protein [Iamia majanohamensis]WCO66462.1 hypothetical protein PO878_18345 [Iamia majanohamensis]